MELPFVQRWIDKFFQPKNLSKSILGTLADKSGVDVVNSPKTGEAIPVPEGLTLPDSDIGFYSYWLNTFKYKSDDRNRRYRTFDIMDQNSGEVALTLDTYRDEALGVGFLKESPIKFYINNRDAEERILEILDKCNFMKDSESNVRSLCKYGDLYYHIVQPDTNDPKNLILRKLSPFEVEIIYLRELSAILGYKINDISKVDIDPRQIRVTSHTIDNRRLNPWEVAHFSIVDEDYYPYGRSVIDKLRTVYDQLVTMEALYAITRASKLERIVVKIPTGKADPATAFQKLQHIRAVWKSVIIGQGSQGRFASNKELGLTDHLWIPGDKDYAIEKLSSSIDVSSDEDVRYFLEKLINGTGLPKGYFITDQSTLRGAALAKQDLKFARKLLPIQKAYAAGCTRLITLLGLMLGYKDIEVETKIEEPSDVSQEQVAQWSAQIAAARSFIETFQSLIPSDSEESKSPESESQTETSKLKLSPEQIVKIMIKFGVPKDIAMILVNKDRESKVLVSVNTSDIFSKPIMECLWSRQPFSEKLILSMHRNPEIRMKGERDNGCKSSEISVRLVDV